MFGFTAINEFVDELLHVYVLAPLTVKVAELPEQIAVCDAAILILGLGFTFIEIVSELEQPLIFVPLTVNVDVTFGETIIEGEFAPVLHENVLAPFAVKVDELPLHITEKEVVAVIVGF